MVKPQMFDGLVDQINYFQIGADFPKLGRHSTRLDAHSYFEDGRSNKFVLLSIQDVTAA
jgi:hypothetical protein